MGMIVSVYRCNHGDCSNGGVTGRVNELTITNVEGPFEPTPDAPAAKLVKRDYGNLVVIPDGLEGKWTMFGGCYASTSDARFARAVEKFSGYNFDFPVAIFDRVEH